MENNILTVTKEFRFSAAHRLWRHGDKHKNIHGHNYRVLVSVEPQEPNEWVQSGKVLDFDEFEKFMGSWIEKKWDHAFMYHREDRVIHDMFKDTPLKTFSGLWNPTTENIANHLFSFCTRMYKDKLNILKVTVYDHDFSFSSAIKEA